MTYSIADFRRDMRHGPYAWPGGYPLYFVMSDGAALSFKAARSNARLILGAIQDGDSSGWCPIGLDINYEDANLYCADSGERIPSAYADD